TNNQRFYRIMFLSGDFDDNRGHIVGGAVTEGNIEQFFVCLLEIFDLAENLVHLMLANIAAQAIRTQQPTIFWFKINDEEVDLRFHFNVTEHSHNRRASRVNEGFLWGDSTGFDEALHEGMIGGNLLQ